jgi:tRNA-uridine 2-sulfurtransferase
MDEKMSVLMGADQKKTRALGLSSGGLDSILAALVLRDTGIEVEWITFETPFFSSEKAQKAARLHSIPVMVQNITAPYLEMLKNPPCGYGKNMNPCMDCHALMFKLAGVVMKEKGFDFLFSGEVLGQRPMSQTRPSLGYVEKHSGFGGYILRPLSAIRLPETIPEKTGLVNRELLLGITGRSRKPQIELAKKYGVTDYPAPAGGCLLTAKGYSARLKDLFENQDQHSENELHLLKYGRHFRISKYVKVIVGRSKDENSQIMELLDPSKDILLKAERFPGPTVLLTSGETRENIHLAASICIGYSKAPRHEEHPVMLSLPGDRKETIMAKAIEPDRVKNLMIL